MKKIIFLLFLAHGLAHADDIRLGIPSMGGTGCPAGTASAVLSPDNQALSILFDSFQVQADYLRPTDRKSCNIAIPVHVPQGFSVAILGIDYRGFNNLPVGSMSQFNVEYFFAGLQGPRFSKVFVGPLSDDYLINNTLVASSVVWSRCGTDVILRTNSSMLTRTNSYGEQTLATVDSADIGASLIYHLQWKSCR